jgi:hypothetical protein
MADLCLIIDTDRNYTLTKWVYQNKISIFQLIQEFRSG